MLFSPWSGWVHQILFWRRRQQRSQPITTAAATAATANHLRTHLETLAALQTSAKMKPCLASSLTTSDRKNSSEDDSSSSSSSRPTVKKTWKLNSCHYYYCYCLLLLYFCDQGKCAVLLKTFVAHLYCTLLMRHPVIVVLVLYCILRHPVIVVLVVKIIPPHKNYRFRAKGLSIAFCPFSFQKTVDASLKKVLKN